MEAKSAAGGQRMNLDEERLTLERKGNLQKKMEAGIQKVLVGASVSYSGAPYICRLKSF